ncbi:MAG: hypothetical protein GYB31_10880 [Bacteroidetes bacterium]|nr:hypothetical protein [Bacteroidota bacterium]
MSSTTSFYFVDQKNAIRQLVSSGQINRISQDNFAKKIAVCANNRLWAVLKSGHIAYTDDAQNWKEIHLKNLKIDKIEGTPQGNAILLAADGSIYGLESDGKMIMLAQAGHFTDISAGADGSLWFVAKKAGEKENVLVYTTLDQLRPQPVWSGALGKKVAASPNGSVAFLTLSGEVASCDPFSMGSLCSEAGKAFGDAICVDSSEGTYFVLRQEKKGKKNHGRVFAWNPEKDSHNSWRELKGVDALEIAAA